MQLIKALGDFLTAEDSTVRVNGEWYSVGTETPIDTGEAFCRPW